jgi:hypothetical protein
MVGVPARQVGWMSEYGERLSLPVDGEAVLSVRTPEKPIVWSPAIYRARRSSMRVEAIYDDGRLELPAGVHLKHSRITLTVVIPDDEIAVGVTGETGEPSQTSVPERSSVEKRLRSDPRSARPSMKYSGHGNNRSRVATAAGRRL